MQLLLKILSGMANSVDPDQTAPRAVCSGSAMFGFAILSDTLVYKILGHFTGLLMYQANLVFGEIKSLTQSSDYHNP